MDEEKRKELYIKQMQGMRAVSNEQMEEIQRRHYAGAMNRLSRPEDYEGVRNVRIPEIQAAAEPAPIRKQTIWQRLKKWALDNPT